MSQARDQDHHEESAVSGASPPETGDGNGSRDWRERAEERLRHRLGKPPDGTTWMARISRENDGAPLLTGQQRERLALLLQGEAKRDGAGHGRRGEGKLP